MYFYPHFPRTKYVRYRHYKMCPSFQSHQTLYLNPNSSASEAKFLPTTLFLPFLMIISTFYTSLILILWDFQNLQTNPQRQTLSPFYNSGKWSLWKRLNDSLKLCLSALPSTKQSALGQVSTALLRSRFSVSLEHPQNKGTKKYVIHLTNCILAV